MARSRTKRTFCHNNDILGQVTNETDLLPQQLYPWPGHERNGPSATTTISLARSRTKRTFCHNNYILGQVTNETDLLPHAASHKMRSRLVPIETDSRTIAMHGQVTNETDLLPHNYGQGKVTIEMDLAAFDHYG
jgi:hypothetical protein